MCTLRQSMFTPGRIYLLTGGFRQDSCLTALTSVIIVPCLSNQKHKGHKEMIEFTSKPQKTKNSFTLIITGILLVLIMAGIFALFQYQRSNPAQTGGSKIVVEDLLRPGNTDFEYYKTRIRIEDVKGVVQINFNNNRFAQISGTIVNDGDRSLDALEMKIILLDVWGKVSKERTAFALWPDASYIKKRKPIEPLGKRHFSIGVESVEYYWDPKQVSYEITGLRYQ